MKLTVSEHYKMEMVKLFSRGYGDVPKPVIMIIMSGFSTEHYFMQALKYFKAWFRTSDVVN